MFLLALWHEIIDFVDYFVGKRCRISKRIWRGVEIDKCFSETKMSGAAIKFATVNLTFIETRIEHS